VPSISPNRPAVLITFDKPRPVRFSWTAICDFEEAYKKSLPKAFSEDVGPRLLTYVAWVGMRHAEPNLTLDQVKARINRYLENGGDIGQLSTDLVKALVDSGVLGKARVATAQTDDLGDAAPEAEVAEADAA
jgi:hypothetical protein